MISAPCKCTNDLPTRITNHSKTLIDHIYINNVNHSYISGVIISDLSGHFETFIYASNKKRHDAIKVHRIRDIGNFNLEMFLEELSNKLNTSGLSDCNEVNEKFNNFFNILKRIVNKRAPPKHASRKER